MQSVPPHPSNKFISRWFVPACACFVLVSLPAFGQYLNINMGPDGGFQQIDFAQIQLDQVNRNANKSDQQRKQDKEMIESGVISSLDLQAPLKALEEYNHGNAALRAQHGDEAIKHLRRAVDVYPKFVSAHISLGLAYIDAEDKPHARTEFETAAKLDPKFPGSFTNLGLVALATNDFETAQPQFEKAASLHPQDAKILTSLAYAQNGNHHYQDVLQTAKLVHSLSHKGMANVHYVAASAAMSLKDYATVANELNLFLGEDPTNAFAPVARQNLATLARHKIVADSNTPAPALVASLQPPNLANTERLKSQLTGLDAPSASDKCEECGTFEANEAPESTSGNASAMSSLPAGPAPFTIRTNVDQVTLFFAVSSHGHMVNDLQESNIRVLDDHKPPEKIEQFAPQSKLPLRLALLVDTSGSVRERFTFEKHAATKFVEKMLSGAQDLAFIEGFSEDPTITQDFTGQPGDLGQGIDKLANGGGTALFDAVGLACRKLAAYPESERVARVLVVLSDGEDNSSHSSLKQSIQTAERTGVTVYTVSTREDRGDKTDADRILEALAERTGGEAMFPGDIMTLGKSFDKLRELIRSRYFIAYKPADFQPDGSYRTITVTAEKDGKRLQVRARKGYRARLAATPN